MLIPRVLLLSCLFCLNWLPIFTTYSWSTEFEKLRPEQKIFTAAAFGPDKKLWRIVPSQQFVSVDYSTDYGKTFSAAVRIHSVDQSIHLWDENPPSIAVDRKGGVYVLYFADDKQSSTSFFSYSSDGTQFSTPTKISSTADSWYHYQTEMLLDTSDQAHFLWHDVRDRAEYKKLGGGDLSLYYNALKMNTPGTPPEDKRVARNTCSCCRTAIDKDKDGNLIILARFVYADNIRDHGLLKISPDKQASESWRVTFDDWQIEGCPTHGPALSIAQDGRYHIAWFTQGEKRSGLYYAFSDDQGKHFSSPMQIGDPEKLPGRADVLALNKEVALVWKVFDGIKTRIESMYSMDSGKQWSPIRILAESGSQSAHPALISDGEQIYLSWNSLDTGYMLVPVKPADIK